MREPEEVEGLGLSLRSLLPSFSRVAAELDQSRLLGVKLKAELRQPLAQLGEEPFGFVAMLERSRLPPGHEVVGVADDEDIARRVPTSPLASAFAAAAPGLFGRFIGTTDPSDFPSACMSAFGGGPFADRTRVPTPRIAAGISRLPCEELAHVQRAFDCALRLRSGLGSRSPLSRAPMSPTASTNGVGALEPVFSQLNAASQRRGKPRPCQRFARLLAEPNA